jgi:hypothetical protein
MDFTIRGVYPFAIEASVQARLVFPYEGRLHTGPRSKQGGLVCGYQWPGYNLGFLPNGRA